MPAASSSAVAAPAALPLDTSSPLAREPFILIPARYSGNLGTCSQFLHQCSLVFSQQSNTYATHQSKVAFVMSLLTEKASMWALAVSQNNPSLCSDIFRFFLERCVTFLTIWYKVRKQLALILLALNSYPSVKKRTQSPNMHWISAF